MYPPDYSDLTIVIPTLNEERNIFTLLNKIDILYPNSPVLVVDDGSVDETRDVVRAFGDGVALIDRSSEHIHGLTASVINGIMLTETEYFVVIDGDLQHPPEKIKEIVNILRDGYDLVVGVRKDVSGWQWYRRAISDGASMLGQIALILRGAPKCNDIMSGFFGAKTEFVLPYIQKYTSRFEMSGFKILFDLLKMLPEHTSVREVPYVFGERDFGSSKMGASHMLAYMKSLVI